LAIDKVKTFCVLFNNPIQRRDKCLMNRINFYLTFLFNSKNRLMTIVEAKMNEEEINLSKSSFMLFYTTMKQPLMKKILISRIV